MSLQPGQSRYPAPLGRARYQWTGWYDGETDCEPPEPGKLWIEIHDDDWNEACIIVIRADAPIYTSEDADPDRLANDMAEREERARVIVDALNYYEEKVGK
jgi:hypothetical protein